LAHRPLTYFKVGLQEKDLFFDVARALMPLRWYVSPEASMVTQDGSRRVGVLGRLTWKCDASDPRKWKYLLLKSVCSSNWSSATTGKSERGTKSPRVAGQPVAARQQGKNRWGVQREVSGEMRGYFGRQSVIVVEY
jgi:hypothetical protein